MSDWAGQRVTVMGLGRFGGGLGVAVHLARHGAAVTVSDAASERDLAGPIRALRDATLGCDLTLQLGRHDPAAFEDADTVVVNPAVPRPWEHPCVLAAAGAGARVTTEIRIVVDALPSAERMIAVTGSAGKSTTAAMIAHLLTRMDRPCVLGGNIGGSLLDRIGEITAGTWVVLELSSAMLWWLNQSPFGAGDTPLGPAAAVLTTYAPNHIDWHGSEAHYASAKRSLLDHLRPDALAVLGPQAPDWPSGGRSHRARALPEHASLALPGAHNRDNASTAVEAAVLATGVDRVEAIDAAGTFTGLPHRLQVVGRFRTRRGSVLAINDSKCTTPEAAARAVEAVGHLGPLRLIAGGHDKGSDLSSIASLPVEAVYGIGATAQAVANGTGGVVCGTLERAVRSALDASRDGDVMLLSPGCASWDQFTHFERRGERFIELLRELAEEIPL